MSRRLLWLGVFGILALVGVLGGASDSSAASPPSMGNAIEVPGTATRVSGGYAFLSSVSCATVGNCAVGGHYPDGSGNAQAFVVDETNGSWGDAIEVPGAATLNSGGFASVSSVSCATVGNCTAGG